MLETITQKQFQSEVLEASQLVLVDYWSPTCGPCDLYNQVLENYNSEIFPDLKKLKVNVDQEIKLADQEAILVMPTTKIYFKGECVKTILGVQSPKDLQLILENLGL